LGKPLGARPIGAGRHAAVRDLASLFIRQQTPSIEEQYLAQAIDANDFEVRLQALERARP
jgi:hypothetical protein